MEVTDVYWSLFYHTTTGLFDLEPLSQTYQSEDKIPVASNLQVREIKIKKKKEPATECCCGELNLDSLNMEVKGMART